MFERAKSAFGWSKPAPEAVTGIPVTADAVVAEFPRGLPGGDRNKPVGTARWISSTDACGLLGEWEPGRFLIGRDSAGRYVGHADDRHILTVAGSRAGKGVSLIVPNLLHWPGSCIAIDPKGELATITASRRSSAGSKSRRPWATGRQGLRARSVSARDRPGGGFSGRVQSARGSGCRHRHRA